MKPKNKKLLVRIGGTLLFFGLCLMLLFKFGDVVLNKDSVNEWLNDKIKLLNPVIVKFIFRYGWQIVLAVILSWRFYKWTDKKADYILQKFLGPVSSFQAGGKQIKNKHPLLNPYFRDFSYELDAVKTFVGGQYIFDFLEKFQKENKCGYVRLTAGAGMGKSALAATVCDRYEAPGFFTNASRGMTQASDCLNHLTVLMIAKYLLPHESLDLRAGQNSEFFENILEEASKKSKGKPIWFVVDALDEAQPSGIGGNTLLLPPHLPQGVFGFVTQRPGNYPLLSSPDTPISDYEISFDSSEHKLDVANFIQAKLKNETILQTLKKFIPPISEKEFSDFLEQSSEGNFMYLNYLFAEMISGQFSFTSLHNSDMPRGLQNYYETTWARMEGNINEKNPALWDTLFKPVIWLLAVAREDVSVKWLAELSGIGALDIRDRVLSQWARFLRKEGSKSDETWAIMHRSFGDFLNEKLDLGSIHHKVANYFNESKNWPAFNNYASRHLTNHYSLAGEANGLFSLVNNHAWFENQLTHDQTGLLFESDLRTAWIFAERFDLSAVRKGKAASYLHKEFQFALSVATLRNYWMNIRPGALAMLLEANVLNNSQALALVKKSHEPDSACLLLDAIGPILDEKYLAEAIQYAQTLPESDKTYECLLNLNLLLPVQNQQGYLNDILTKVRNTKDQGQKAKALIVIADKFTGSERQEILRESINSVAAIEDDSHKFEVLLEAGTRMPEHPGLLNDLLTLSRSTDDPKENIEELIPLIAVLPIELKSPSIQQILDFIKNDISSSEEKIFALSALVKNKDAANDKEVMSYALKLARESHDPSNKTDILLPIAATRDAEEKNSLIKESEIAARQIIYPLPRAIALAGVGAQLNAPESQLMIQEARNLLKVPSAPEKEIDNLVAISASVEKEAKLSFIKDALTLTSQLSDPISKAQSLMSIAREMENGQAGSIIKEIANIPGGILVIGKQDEDKLAMTELLASLFQQAQAKTEFKDGMIVKTLDLADKIRDPYEKLKAYTALIEYVDKPTRNVILEQIREATVNETDPGKVVELLTLIVDFVPAKDKIKTLQTAEAAASEITNQASFTGFIDMETGRVDINYSPISIQESKAIALLTVALKWDERNKERLVKQIFDVFLDLPAHTQQTNLTTLAYYLSTEQINWIILQYRNILQDPLRKGFYDCLANNNEGVVEPKDDMQPDENKETENPDDTLEDHTAKFSLTGYAANLFRFCRNEDEPVLVIEGVDTVDAKVMETIRYNLGHNWCGQVTAENADDNGWEDIEQAARSFMNENGWGETLSSVFNALIKRSSPESAQREAKSIWPEQYPAEILAIFAPYLEAAELKNGIELALESCEGIADAYEYARAVASLLPYFSNEESYTRYSLNLINRFETLCSEKSYLQLSSGIMSNLMKIKPEYKLMLIQTVLHFAQSRKDLLVNTKEILPLISALGETDVPKLFAEVILENSARWH